MASLVLLADCLPSEPVGISDKLITHLIRPLHKYAEYAQQYLFERTETIQPFVAVLAIQFHLQNEQKIKYHFGVIIGQLYVPAMLRYIEFIREEWSDTSKLHDTFPAVHDCYLILTHKLIATLSSDELNFFHCF